MIRATAIALIAAPLLLATTAEGQEYCVVCTEPDATYRCSVNVTKPPGMPLKMLCITSLAREGGHATCAVRGGTVFDCQGPLRRVTATGSAASENTAAPGTETPGREPAKPGAVTTGPAVVAPAPVRAAPPRPETEPGTGPAPRSPETAAPPKSAKKKDGPQTVEELAKQVGQSSTKTLKKAGDAIEGSTKKAWKCLTSLFQSC